MSERKLVFNLVGLHRLPDIIAHLVVFPLPRFGRSNLFGVVSLLVFCSLRVKICLAQVMEKRHDDQAFVRDFRKNRLPYRAFPLRNKAVVYIQTVLQEPAFTSQVVARGGRGGVEVSLALNVSKEFIDTGPIN